MKRMPDEFEEADFFNRDPRIIQSAIQVSSRDYNSASSIVEFQRQLSITNNSIAHRSIYLAMTMAMAMAMAIHLAMCCAVV